MIKKVTFSLFLSSFIIICKSQDLKISGSISQIPADTKAYIKLSLQRGSKEIVIDSVLPDKTGKFGFSSKRVKSQGFYQISYNGGNKTEFILGKEPLTGIEGRFDVVSKSGFYVKGREMDAILVLENLKTRYNLANDSILTKGEKFDEFDPQFLAKSKQREKAFEDLNLQFNSSIRTISILFPGTYASEVMSNWFKIPLKQDFPELDKIFDTQKAFLNKNYFKYIDFSDERFINCKYVETSIFTFLSRHSSLTLEGFKSSVDGLLKMAEKNEIVRAFILTYFTELFAEKGPPEMLDYLTTTYGSSCEANFTPQTQDMLNKLKALKIGNIAPEISVPDINMQNQNLSANLGKNATLVYFYSSTCSHCKVQTPKVFEIYKKFKEKGFNVFAISLDTDFSEWVKFLQDKQLIWTNVSDLKGWKSKVVENYMVNKTPTLYLLDGSRKILDKDFSFEELESKLATYLK